VPLSQRAIAGAPLSATISQLSRIRTQSLTQAQGVTNGLPILVESSGMVATWAGSMVTWVTNAATSQDVPQTSGVITATSGLPINNPGFTQACIGSLAAACIVHPTAWTFGTSSANGKTVGKQTLNIAFGDGTTGQTFDYVYDGWNLPCNSGWVYTNGVPVANAVKATSDIYADCVAQTIVFPKGAVAFGVPTQDQYGRAETIMPTITAAIFIGSATVNFPMASVGQGQVYGINTQDGGMAKVYFLAGAGVAINAAAGMSLHANANGTYPF
jgi:hypothetical protein